MQSGKIMGFAVVMLLAACNSSAIADQTTSVAEASPLIEKNLPCPSQDFSSFLTAFMEDVALQKAFTRYPYAVTLYDPQDLEADPKVQQLDVSETQFPIILSASEMADHGVTAKSEKKADDWYEVSTQSSGSGAYTMTLNFRRMQGCWFLTDSIDAST